jgi:ribosomal protein S20
MTITIPKDFTPPAAVRPSGGSGAGLAEVPGAPSRRPGAAPRPRLDGDRAYDELLDAVIEAEARLKDLSDSADNGVMGAVEAARSFNRETAALSARAGDPTSRAAIGAALGRIGVRGARRAAEREFARTRENRAVKLEGLLAGYVDAARREPGRAHEYFETGLEVLEALPPGMLPGTAPADRIAGFRDALASAALEGDMARDPEGAGVRISAGAYDGLIPDAEERAARAETARIAATPRAAASDPAMSNAHEAALAAGGTTRDAFRSELDAALADGTATADPIATAYVTGLINQNEAERHSARLAEKSKFGAKFVHRIATETSKSSHNIQRNYGDLITSSQNATEETGEETAGRKMDEVRPIINMEKDRTENIIEDKPALFEIAKNPKADGSPVVWEIPSLGNWAVRRYEPLISEISDKHGVDANLVRAIMWTECARGHKVGFDKLADKLRISGRVLPMNVDKQKWSSLIGKSADDMYSSRNSIEAGVVLIKRIQQRIEDPTPEKIGSLWLYLGRENTSDFGAYVQRIYDERPWENH